MRSVPPRPLPRKRTLVPGWVQGFTFSLVTIDGHNDIAAQESGVEIETDRGLRVLRRLLTAKAAETALTTKAREAPATASATSTKETLEERAEAAAASALERAEVEAFKRIATALTAKATSTAAKGIGLLPLFTILVVFLTLLRIANDVVGLIQGLELRLGLGVVRVQVGMELLGSLDVSLLHILLRNVLRDTQNLVIIYKCHNLYSFLFSNLTAIIMPN